MSDKEINKYFKSNKLYRNILIIFVLLTIVLYLLKSVNKIFIGLSFIMLNLSIIYLIKFLISYTKASNFNKHFYLDKVISDIKEESTKNYSSYQIILTDKYLISLRDLRIIYYKDIVWAYPYTFNDGAIVTLQVALNNKKKYDVALSNGHYDNYYMINEILKIIKNKNKKIIIGFNKENKKKYESIIK